MYFFLGVTPLGITSGNDGEIGDDDGSETQGANERGERRDGRLETTHVPFSPQSWLDGKLASLFLLAMMSAGQVGVFALAIYGAVAQNALAFCVAWCSGLATVPCMMCVIYSSRVCGFAHSVIGWRRQEIEHLPRVGERAVAAFGVRTTYRGSVWRLWVSTAGIRGWVLMAGSVSIPKSEIDAVYKSIGRIWSTCVIVHRSAGVVSPIHTSAHVYDIVRRIMPDVVRGDGEDLPETE